MAKQETISTEAIDLLKRSEIGENYITLPEGKIERVLYEEANEVISRLGGKWKGAGKYKDGSPKGKHLFKFEVPNIFNSIIETGLMPPKNPTAFFPTPKKVIDLMIKWSEINRLPDDLRVLEPSAGMGAIAEAILEAAPNAKLDLVEFLDINARSLEAKGFKVHKGDFLKFKPEYKYDLILMNPPFSVEEDKKAYITHINYAFSLLDREGVLVAIAPRGYSFASDKLSKGFNETISNYGEDEELPDGSFKESGTGVATNIIFLKNQDYKWREEPHNGYPCWHSWHFDLYSDNSRELQELKDKLMKDIKEKGGFDMFKKPDLKTISLIDKYIDDVISSSVKEKIRIPLTEKARENIKEGVIEDFFYEYK